MIGILCLVAFILSAVGCGLTPDNVNLIITMAMFTGVIAWYVVCRQEAKAKLISKRKPYRRDIQYGRITTVEEEEAEKAKEKAKEKAEENEEIQFDKTTRKGITILVALGIISALALSSFSRIETGHTGILISFGRVEQQTYSEGIVFRPFWKNMIQMDNRVQKNGHDDKPTILEVYTKDSQEVDIEYTVLYKLNRENASRLYKEIGVDYYKTVLVPIVQEEVKKECAKYQADEFLAKREQLAKEIEENIKVKFAESYIELVSTSIQDLKFTKEYENAVEQKQIAMQSKLKAEQEAEKLKIEVDAKAYNMERTAEAEAKANELKQKTITDNLIKYEMIQKWNGQLPKVEGGQAIIDMRGVN